MNKGIQKKKRELLVRMEFSKSDKKEEGKSGDPVPFRAHTRSSLELEVGEKLSIKKLQGSRGPLMYFSTATTFSTKAEMECLRTGGVPNSEYFGKCQSSAFPGEFLL